MNIGGQNKDRPCSRKKNACFHTSTSFRLLVVLLQRRIESFFKQDWTSVQLKMAGKQVLKVPVQLPP
jgi:hypothetical protein